MGQEDTRPTRDDTTAGDRSACAICTREVCVLSTSIDDTRLAIGVAQDLARALAVPLTVVAFNTATDPNSPLPTDDPSDALSSLVRGLRFQGSDIRVRSYVCETERQAIPFAFRPHSLIVMGARRSWLPTRTERVLRSLEAAGHFVLCVHGSTTHHDDQRFS
jgi:hypothetical protein